MAHFTCEQCGTGFVREKSGLRPIRFCTYTCYRAWRKDAKITAGQFRPGLTPWNKGVKGIHMSPSTEFKPNCKSNRALPVGSVTFRHRHNRREGVRAWIKVANPTDWRERARYVWEQRNGAIPNGMVIHHLDGDSTNDAIDNLAVLTRAAHINIHRKKR